MIKKHFLTVDLKDDPDLIKEYEYWHRSENIWREITDGIRKVGIREMEIYRWRNRLLMFVQADEAIDIDNAFKQLKVMDRQVEWEEFMNKFQQAPVGADPSSKWQPMEKIFTLSNSK